MTDSRLNELTTALAAHGMIVRGGFAPVLDDEVPALANGRQAQTLLLVGNAGPAMYRHFFAAAESRDKAADPLDSWTRRAIAPIATQFGALALFPFGGPPWHPFQRWAKRAEGLKASPLGILMHPEYGLWHAYRAALLFDREIALPAPAAAAGHPCDACAAKPCLSTCPAGAITPEGYRVEPCARHVISPVGSDCRTGGCLARRACPVGASHAYPAQAMDFHMAAFLKGQGLAD